MTRMQERDIFIDALQIDAPVDREAFLASACADDEGLRQRVERLLIEHQRQESFLLDAPPPAVIATVTDRPLTERAGDTIGPYKLLEQIGEGGFGVVFMAEQTAPVKRKVALKVIKPGMDTREVIARFEAERQALALMDHPNIAKVLDAGATETGRPFFVMELVRGVPITEYCDQAQLTPRQRLELFVAVCQAVQHAHQKGIIHRDIKPSNVLVALHDDRPVVKVIDFGIAKATSGQLTDKTLFTGFAQVVGTPLYMSPEQAALSAIDIDTRSDIYSLGVLLYELLTGTTPFDKTRLQQAAFEEIRRIIREEEPQKPSTRLSSLGATLPSVSAVRKTEPRKLSQLVRGDLDWIVMKALEKDRARRYDSANGFASDILRYLADEPVEACPPAATYRFRKFARRNKVALATTAAVCVALVAGIIGTTWQAVRATREATRASNAETLAQERYTAERAARAAEQEQRRVADLQRLRAEENFDIARRAVDEYLSQVSESELLSVPGLQPLREDLLRAALTFYAEFTQERADDPTIQQELASAHFRLGRIHSELGDKVSSRAANNEAIRLYEPLRDGGHFDREMQVALAWAYYYASRFDDAISLCQDVLNAEPENAEAASLLADVYNTLAAYAHKNRNDVAAALQYYRQAFELREALVRRDPDNPRYLARHGTTLNNLGLILIDQLELDQALTMFERGAEYVQQAYELEPHSIAWGRWLCNQLGNLAELQSGIGREQEALASYQRLVAVSRKLAFENPAVTSLRGDQYRALLFLARYQQQLGDTGEAARLFREAREVLENIPRETPDQLYELATVYAALAQPVERVVELSEEDVAEQERNIDLALETLDTAVDGGFADSQKLKSERLFDVLRERDDFQQILSALESAAEAQRLAGPNSGSDDQTLADRLRAAELLTDAVKERPGSRRHRSTLAATLHSIGVIQMQLKQYPEAEESLRRALQIREALLQEQPDDLKAKLDVLVTESEQGRWHWLREEYAEAHQRWQECLGDLYQFADAHRDDQRLQSDLASRERWIYEHYARLGLFTLAGEYAVRAVEFRRVLSADGQFSVVVHTNDNERLAHDYYQQYAEQLVKAGDGVSHEVMLLVRGIAALGLSELFSEEVIAQAQSVFDEMPDHGWIAVSKAMIDYHHGRFAAAQVPLQRFSDGKSNQSSQIAFLKAAIAARSDDADRARQLWAEAEARYARESWQALDRDVSDSQRGVFDDDWFHFAYAQVMRRLAVQAMTDEPASGDPWQHLIQARGYRLIGEIEKADRELAAAVAASPDDANVCMARARLLTDWDDPARPAEADWQRAVELAGDDPLPWIQRGYWYAKHGQQQKADADFAKADLLSPNLAKAPFSAEAAADYQQAWASQRGVPVEFTNSIGMQLRLIPPGEFMMGTPAEVAKQIAEYSDAGVLNHERTIIADEPAPHLVLVSRPYYLGKFEVTRSQFRQFVEASGYRTVLERNGLGGWSKFQGPWVRRAQHVWSSPGEWQPKDDEPACHLTWSDAVAFCEWLSQEEGRRYVLPTEAQWEFACRAGTTEATYAAPGETLADIAWTNELLGSYDAEQHRPQPVGRKRPNAFGLYDMLGNVWEFCADWYAPIPHQTWPRIDPTGPVEGDTHVLRGGGWYRSGSVFARSSVRLIPPGESSDAGIGFRVAIVAEAEGLIGAVSQQELAALRQKRWERELDQLPEEEFWNSARMRLCREIAADAELFDVIQQLHPDDADLSIARGQILAQAEKWDEAAEWFGRVINSRGVSDDAFQSACLHLLTDRPDAYRQFCTKLIGQAGDVSDPHVAFILARTCILVPEMPASPEQVVSWAELAVSHERSPWGLHVLGAAFCRSGQYSRAAELLEESIASKWSAAGESQNALVLAIAHQRQGNLVAAAECLDRARALMAVRTAPQNWMEYHVLVREAEALIEANPPEDVPDAEQSPER